MKKTIAIKWTLAALFTLGILLAGSDGAHMPWGNIAGVMMVGVAALLAKRAA